MPQLKTPGVYIKETSTLAPSVAQISTAIPVFIGYTEKTNRKENALPVAVKVNSMLEYSKEFGGAFVGETKVTIKGESIDEIESPDVAYHMVPFLEMYFNNGGGTCYIISLGKYKTGSKADFVKADFEDGLEALSKEDEPTIINLTDALQLNPIDYHDLAQKALKQCADLKDRFCILDVLNSDAEGKELSTDDAVSGFRNSIGSNNLMYGAAYYPYLKTTLTHPFDDDSVVITGYGDSIKEHINNGKNGLGVYYKGTDEAKVTIATGSSSDISVDLTAKTISITAKSDATAKELEALWLTKTSTEQGDFELKALGRGNKVVLAVTDESLVLATDASSAGKEKVTLGELKYDQSELYNNIRAQLSLQRMTLPPSAAVTGIYANTDRNIGVWKAPANVGVASVIEPVRKLNSFEQGNLNIDSTAGKSVNVIRSFAGRGNIVWGARTLLGNDNEWRYINVRRLFSVVEESIQKSTHFAVFEPNTPLTWLKVRAMIESYLEDLWKAGGLVGTTREQAYFVNVGLGTTMTSQDILEGKMNVDVGLAVSRPAEFITINFTHLLQEA